MAPGEGRGEAVIWREDRDAGNQGRERESGHGRMECRRT